MVGGQVRRIRFVTWTVRGRTIGLKIWRGAPARKMPPTRFDTAFTPEVRRTLAASYRRPRWPLFAPNSPDGETSRLAAGEPRSPRNTAFPEGMSGRSLRDGLGATPSC